jgi:hypothetical protein
VGSVQNERRVWISSSGTGHFLGLDLFLEIPEYGVAVLQIEIALDYQVGTGEVSNTVQRQHLGMFILELHDRQKQNPASKIPKSRHLCRSICPSTTAEYHI